MDPCWRLNMKVLTQKNIQNDLPVHDSDFLGYKVLQKDNGETDLVLDIAFCEGEFDDLDEDYKDIIKSDGTASFLFLNCWWINIGIICNITQRDSIDYIQFLSNSKKLKELNAKKEIKHVEVIFISGSKLECISENVALI